jgi:hypothetical protein
MDNKENEGLNKIIEQMKNKIRVMELEKQIEEIRNRKEQKRKKEEEKKIAELINNHNKTVENLRKQKEDLKLNLLYKQIMPFIETIMQKHNNHFDVRIKKFEEEILSNKINIDGKNLHIIKKNNEEMNTKVKNINNYLKEINDQIISIEKEIKVFKEYQNKILKEKTESIIKAGIKKDNNSLNKDSNNANQENLINDIGKKSSKDINNNYIYLKKFLEEYCYHQNKMDDSKLKQLYVTLKDKGIQEPFDEVRKAYYKFISPNFKKNNIDENGIREIENRIIHIKKLFTNLNEKNIKKTNSIKNKKSSQDNKYNKKLDNNNNNDNSFYNQINYNNNIKAYNPNLNDYIYNKNNINNYTNYPQNQLYRYNSYI